MRVDYGPDSDDSDDMDTEDDYYQDHRKSYSLFCVLTSYHNQLKYWMVANRMKIPISAEVKTRQF